MDHPWQNVLADHPQSRYQKNRIAHWDKVACRRDSWRGWGKSYHRRIEEIYRFLISPGRRMLEIGCGTGDFLASLRPAYRVGVDFFPRMIPRGPQRHPPLEVVQAR